MALMPIWTKWKSSSIRQRLLKSIFFSYFQWKVNVFGVNSKQLGGTLQLCRVPQAQPVEPVAEVPAQPSSTPPEAKPVEPVAETEKPEPTTAKAPDISIHFAARKGNIEAVKKHLDAGVDIHVLDKKYGFAPLHYAAEGGYKEIVELLLAKGADVNQRDKVGKTPTYWAMRYGRKEVTAILRKHGGKT